MKILVTLGGECFEAEEINVRNADGRDGVLYYFKLRDLGERSRTAQRSGLERTGFSSKTTTNGSRP